MQGTQADAVKGRRKNVAMPVLIVLFVISYSMLIKLVIEQDKTIDSQHTLIRLLMRDNVSLSKLHKHSAALPKDLRPPRDGDAHHVPTNREQSQNKLAEIPSANGTSDQVQAGRFPSAQVPSAQVRTNQVQDHQVQPAPQSSQVPLRKSGPQSKSRAGRNTRRAQKALPAEPPAQLTDPSDMRRATFSI